MTRTAKASARQAHEILDRGHYVELDDGKNAERFTALTRYVLSLPVKTAEAVRKRARKRRLR